MIFLAAGAALGAAASIIGSRSANKAAIEAYKKQAQVVITNYNYNQKQLDMQEQSEYTKAQSQLQEISINGMQNVASVQAAVNEAGYEGNTKKKINTTAQGQVLRQKTAVQDATELAVYQVRNQKQALYIQTQNQLDAMREQTNAQLTGGSQMFMNAVGGALQGAALGSMAGGLAGAVGAGFSTATGAATTAATTAGTTAASAAGTTAATTAATTAGTTATTAAAGTTAASAAGTAASVAQPATFMQGFTEEWAKYWTANSGVVNALSTLSAGIKPMYTSYRGGYY